MKKYTLKNIALLIVLFAVSCKQEPIVTTEPKEVIDTSCKDAGKGSADFTKFIALGSSYTAGFQAGALFNEGQANSLPAILNKQFECVGAPTTFKQPDIKSELGYNIFIDPNPGADNIVLGRLLLQYNGSPDPLPTPQPYPLGDLSAVPNPGLNPGFVYGNGSTVPALNNFGVPAIVLGQALIPQTGSWAAGAGGDPRFNPFYARWAYPGTGTSTILTDAIGAEGTFFMFWLGMDDFMLYAAFGGDASKAPLNSAAAFAGQYGAAVGGLLSSGSSLKGVLVNFPDIFVMPHFTAVPYNPIPLDAATAQVVGGAFAGYNAALDGLVANAGAFGISPALVAEIKTRKVTFAAVENNAALIYDTQLTDLGPYFDGLQGAGAITAPERAALAPYQRVRQTTSTDILPLSAGSVLGTLLNDDPTLVVGVSVPLADQYVIVPVERDSIIAARTAFNTTVATTVSTNSDKLALADVSSGMASLVTAQAAVMNGVTITPNINPPTGIYSEDGLHPNSRGYAFISTFIIDAINKKFGSTIPMTNISKYHATALPIP